MQEEERGRQDLACWQQLQIVKRNMEVAKALLEQSDMELARAGGRVGGGSKMVWVGAESVIGERCARERWKGQMLKWNGQIGRRELKEG